MKNDPTYYSWVNMKTRCLNTRNVNYPRYGGRGIAICDRWLHNYENFLADMGPKPEGLTLEREDNNGPYAPGNCVWATRQEQSRNRRRTVWIEHAGLRLCINDWARHLGVSINSFRMRAAVRGSYVAAILSYDTQPLRRTRNE